MENIADLLSKNMIAVFFVYGLSWFVMGLAVTLVTRNGLGLKMADSLPWLAAVFIVRMMRVFEREHERQLEVAHQERQQMQEQYLREVEVARRGLTLPRNVICVPLEAKERAIDSLLLATMYRP